MKVLSNVCPCRGYVLRYHLNSKSIGTVDFGEDENQYTASDLRSDTLYEFNLAAYINVDERREEGPPAVINVRTSAAGKK